MMRKAALALVAIVAVACFVLIAGAAQPGPGEQAQPADLVLQNGKIVTVDPAKPLAQAIAVRGGTIVAVGSDADVKPLVGPQTTVIDLGGKLAVPGLIESHAHFTGIGRSAMQLNLMKVKNWDEVVAMVAEAVKTAKPGQLISGRGWHQEKWDTKPVPNVEGFPTHASLSKVSPDNPVVLTHASGHASFANAKAMELAGITKDTPNPAGGDILKDAAGNPIGVFRETASGLLGRARSAVRLTAEERALEARKEVELASQACLAQGITSLHDAGTSMGTVDLYKTMIEEGKLGVRLYVMLSTRNADLAKNIDKYRMIGAANQHLTVRTIKRLIDGALGPRGAWLLEPYSDMPGQTGLNTETIEVMRETARIAIEHDFQLSTHAIGDRANRETLNIYEEALKAHPEKKDTRWRIEHAQHIAASDIPRFGALGIIPAMQGIHCTSDGPYVLERLGTKRAEEGAYVWRKLMDTGATIPNGTDAPVEEVDTMPGFHALITRKMKNGQPFYPGQKMSREEALRAYTINGAYAAFEEKIKGSLTVGKLGDITVLSQDLMTIPEDEIPKTEVVYTIVGGKVLYRKSS